MSRDCRIMLACSGLDYPMFWIVCVVVASLSSPLCRLSSPRTIESSKMLYKKLMTHDCAGVVCSQCKGMLIVSDRYNNHADLLGACV